MAKKLIEVAPFLPLDAISKASKADKDKKTGTIKNVHKWFAPMPTPALRALIFAAVVDAPDTDEETAALLRLVEDLVPSDGNAPSDEVLLRAKEAIAKSVGSHPPTVYDPFCGGGSTLVEAQRLGLRAAGSDLNPVPVLISRTLTELVPQVAGRSPLSSGDNKLIDTGHPLDGLIQDVKYYANWVRQKAKGEIGDLYPTTADGATITAWLWAWTARCLNPACEAELPLVTSTWLSKRPKAEAWIEVVRDESGVRLPLRRTGKPRIEATVSRGGATCHVCDSTFKLDQIRDQAGSIGLGLRLIAMVTDGSTGDRYRDPDTATVPHVEDPDALAINLPEKALGFRVQAYGLTRHEDLYLTRQLCMLGRFADAVASVSAQVQVDGGDEIYARTIASILGLAIGKLSQSNSTQVRWKIDSRNGSGKPEPGFGRHAFPMVWDFVEANPFGGSVGDWLGQVDSISLGLRKLPTALAASIKRADARVASQLFVGPTVVITDPPYFDQIGYADLSDFFYVWHRRALREVHPDLYGTILTPKESELIASPFRHGGDKRAAATYFVEGFTDTFRSLRTDASSDYPILIVYAHRQEEKSDLGTASTGWDAMLEAILKADLTIEGTLPIRGTSSSRQIGQGTNSVASYIVMVCRPRAKNLRAGDVAAFRSALRQLLPASAQRLLISGESMVDIRQAAIGPGMEVFCQFASVYDGDQPISVRRALTIINEELGHLLDEQLGDVDDETRWATQWYADHQYAIGDYDEARKLAQVFGLGVDGLVDAGVVEPPRGKGVRLLSRSELPTTWNPALDERVPVWEACQHLVRRLEDGVEAAGRLLKALGARSTGVRQLAQFLANLAIDKTWADEANAYDSLVKSWTFVEQASSATSADDGRLPGL